MHGSSELCANSLPPAAAAAAAQLNLCCINIARAVLALLQVNLEYIFRFTEQQFNPYLKCRPAAATAADPAALCCSLLLC